ncbi:MAG: bifunctional 3,4-dihydroxy-2-butanone 4-phosphate synthase/GTP cyclohydrolase II [Verrucomicrobia bacterium GWF2_62_7]|nr:MAG: bifunctional 3,4-dihydroxy-2-butanone 4-phosphate synthase/GTP cyclohydrolase II [Verrucomicrobia bacterium GWF2_62_7]
MSKKVTRTACDPFDTVEAVIEDIRAGKLVIVTDDEKRENEGDLIMAAEKVTPASVNFIVKHARGLLCVAMVDDDLTRLGIARMVERNRDAFKTAFMVTVDAKHGITTGISAADRAKTIHVLADPKSKPADLVQPGHINPLAARDGGVLCRAGHTEASADLARLAGLHPSGILCEILSEDGTMARLPELVKFKRQHRLKMCSIRDLIQYRHRREKLVERERVVSLPTEFGDFSLYLYRAMMDGQHHVALVKGDVAGQSNVLVRVHSECLTGDVFSSQRCDCGDQLRRAMQMIAKEGRGVIVYLRQEGRGIGLSHKIHAYELQEKEGLDTVEANERLGFKADLREYGVGAQILVDLGLHTIRILTNNPKKVVGLDGFGLKIAKQLPIRGAVTPHNAKYLETKRKKLGHSL